MGRELGVAMARHTLYIDSDSDEEQAPRADTRAMQSAKPQAGGAGLTAAELREERLFPGDIIEYYSMVFVFGDPRGHRIAKVLKVMHEEREYPLRLDSQEMLPSTQMIKRKLNRRGEELEAGSTVWRKIRTFGLVDGQVKGKTRADTLNEGLKNAVSSAFKSVRSEMGKKNKAIKKTPTISSFFGAKVPSTTLENHSKASSPTKRCAKHAKYIDDSPRTAKSVKMKRPRIELTPEPTGKSRAAFKQSSPEERHSRNHRDDHSAEICRDRGRKTDSPKPKIRLQAFLDSIEERKKDPEIELDEYLALDQEKKIAIAEYKSSSKGTKEAPRQSVANGSLRMRATSHGSTEATGGRKKIRIRSMHNYFKAAPRPHPNTKSEAKGEASLSLNFIMDRENNVASNHPVTRHDEQGRHSRDVVKSPKRKGLAPTQKGLDGWINTSKR